MKKNSKSYALNFILIITFTLAVLWFALKDNYQDMMSLIKNVSWYWFIIILSWGLLYTCLIACIYLLLGRKYKKKYSMREAIENAFIGSFFAGITPSSTGGQFGQIYVMKKQGIKMSDGASLLWADFIIYQTTMMVYVTILFFSCFAQFYGENTLFFTLVLIGYGVNACIISALWTMALFPKAYVKLSGLAVSLLSKLHIVKNQERTLDAWTIQLNAFTKEIKRLKNDRELIAKTVLINVIRLTMLYSLPFVICYAMGHPLPYSQLLTVIAMSSFVTMANTFIPIPGASGGTEWAFVLIFSTIIDSTLAKSVMLFWRFSTYFFVMIIGGLIFILAKRRYDHEKMLKEEIEEMKEAAKEEVLP